LGKVQGLRRYGRRRREVRVLFIGCQQRQKTYFSEENSRNLTAQEYIKMEKKPIKIKTSSFKRGLIYLDFASSFGIEMTLQKAF
jgi:hypothetical protein